MTDFTKRFVPPVVVKADDLYGRTPPNDASAEASVNSAVLLAGADVLDRIDFLRAEHFYTPSHRKLYAAALEVRGRGSPVDIQTVATRLRDAGDLDSIGDDRTRGVAWITHMVDATPSVANVEAHASIVIDKARIRRLAEVALTIGAECFGDYGEADLFLDHAEHRVFEVANGEERDATAFEIGDLVDEEMRRQARIEMGEETSGVSTGFEEIDEATGGLREKETWVVAGRPSMGKTAFVTALTRNVAGVEVDGQRLGVFGFSIEMDRAAITTRMIASEAMVSTTRAVSGKMAPNERERYYNAAPAIRGLPFSVDDSPILTPSKMRARLRRAVAKAKADGVRIFLVWLDYVQRAHPDQRTKGGSREREVAEVMTAFAEMAKEFGTVNVALAQLSRDVDKRQGKDIRPRMSDLRESGQIEQDAQNILLLHRPEFYLPDAEKAAPEIRGLAEGILAKARNGKRGICDLQFTDYCARFGNRIQPPADGIRRVPAPSGSSPKPSEKKKEGGKVSRLFPDDDDNANDDGSY